MIEMPMDKVMVGDIPITIVHPFSMRKDQVVVFYHGWSSTSELQISRALLLAAHGYTVFLPDAVHHGKRGTLPDYYAVEAYEFFWHTVFQNMEEFPTIAGYIQEQGYGKPWVMGHSMGGITAMGLAYKEAETIRGAVSFNGSGDWLLTHLFIEARFGVLMSRDWPMYEELAKKSPMSHLEALQKVPIFMTNGDSDVSVDPRAQAHFAAHLEAIGGEGTRVVYPGLGHFVTTNMMDDAIEWMEERK